MHKRNIILIGGSAGSFRVVTGLIRALPANFAHPVVLCLHRLKNVRNGFVEAISVNPSLKIKEPLDNEKIKNGMIYLAPSNYHLMIGDSNTFSLSVNEVVNHSRPSIDILFETAAEKNGPNCLAVILSGANNDGANGMLKLKEAGAKTIVQEPVTAEIPAMPRACLSLFKPDFVFSPDEIIEYISNL